MTPAADDRLIIKQSLARHLINSQFPQWRDLALQSIPINGWDNVTFRLGDQMKVKFPTAERYAAQVAKEHRWLPYLAASLKIKTPSPVAVGKPDDHYPFPWAIQTWIAGDLASSENVPDLISLAMELAEFLLALQRVPAGSGPPPGEHNFFRGGSLQVYDSETRECLDRLKGELDRETATAVWETALASSFNAAGCWVHGDVAPNNLLVVDGHLEAVIDFGCSAVGDPACDLVIAWTLFEGESRDAFHSTIGANREMWARARGWALWKAVLQLSAQSGKGSGSPGVGARLHRLINDLLSEYRQEK